MINVNAILVLGAGKFGSKAAHTLSRNGKNQITVVDANPDRCAALSDSGIKTVCADCIEYLAENLKHPPQFEWIIPAVPLHVAYEWFLKVVPENATVKPLPVPAAVADALPNPIRGAQGQVYTSYADFICPDNCPEPGDICSFTGQARRGILHRTLGQLSFQDYRSVVVQSRQMAPGLGGYRSSDLLSVRDRVLSADGPVLLSTACRCHGVTHAVSVHR